MFETPERLILTALPGMPMVEPGDDLVTLILEGVERAGLSLAAGDVLVVAQKIVSKAEDRYVDLGQVEPTREAVELARAVDKDPRLVELILRESNEVVRYRKDVLVVEHRSGVVLANAGIDQSNIDHPDGSEMVLLLPVDCDRSADRMRSALADRAGVDVGVIVNDSLGRAWRVGTEGTALGVAGVPSVLDLRGQADLFGRELRVTEVGLGDELAAAASLLMGQAAGGSPVVLIRGLSTAGGSGAARALVRDKAMDLFR